LPAKGILIVRLVIGDPDFGVRVEKFRGRNLCGLTYKSARSVKCSAKNAEGDVSHPAQIIKPFFEDSSFRPGRANAYSLNTVP
jgi:hypothetical protein